MLSALLLGIEAPPPGRKTMTIAGLSIGFIYGLLSAGGGALRVIGAMVIGLLVGFGLSLLTRLPLRLPFALGGAIAGMVFGGVAQPLVVLFYSGIGLLVGFFLEPIFSCFNRFYGGVEKGYKGGLGWALNHRGVMMAILVGGITLTGVAFNAIPTGFVPMEDQGYALGFVQAPDGVSLQRTQQINKQVAEVLRTEKQNGLANAAVFSGASLEGNAPNRGLFFFGTKNWSERTEPDQTGGGNCGAV